MATTYYVAEDGDNGNDGLSVGSPFADPGYASNRMTSLDYCYVKSGTYYVTTATYGAGGPVRPGGSYCTMEGYYQTPGDMCVGGTRPIVKATVENVKIFDFYVGAQQSKPALNFIADGDNVAGVTGFSGVFGDYGLFFNCEARNCPLYGFYRMPCMNCVATNNGSHGFISCYCVNCLAGDNGGWGFYGGDTNVRCIAYRNTGGGGIRSVGECVECVTYKNTGCGFDSGNSHTFLDCISVLDTPYAWINDLYMTLYNCASYNVASGRCDGTPLIDLSAITLTEDPFTDGDNGDFSLNDLPGGGALLPGTGLILPNQTEMRDIGALQRSGMGGSGGGGLFRHPGMGGGFSG